MPDVLITRLDAQKMANAVICTIKSSSKRGGKKNACASESTHRAVPTIFIVFSFHFLIIFLWTWSNILRKNV